MSELKVITNHKLYPLVCFHDLPPKVMLDFDYIDDENDVHIERFVFYRDAWYDTGDVQSIRVRREGEHPPIGWSMEVDADHPFADWDSIISETLFSGVLFRMRDDDYVQCGRYMS